MRMYSEKMTRTLLIICLMFMMTIAPLAMADDEPNDDMASAEYIWGGDTVTGTLDASTDLDDYYEVELYEDDELTVVMTGSVGDFDLYLYDSEGYELTSSMNDDSNEEISFVASYDDSYYIDCWAYDGSGSYTLYVSIQYISFDMKATAISAGDTVTGNLNWAGDAERIYKIPLHKDDVLTVTMTSNVGDFDLYLYDFEEDYIDSSEEGGSNEMVEYTITEDGTYYIYLWAYDGNGQYTLEVEVESPGLLHQTWFWMLVIIVIIIIVVIMVAAKVASRPKAGDELFGAAPAQPPPPVQMSQEQQPDEEKTKQVYCENCQKLIPADSAICPYCGTNPFERTF